MFLHLSSVSKLQYIINIAKLNYHLWASLQEFLPSAIQHSYFVKNAMHYGIRADILKKSYQKMFNFENWFLCQFSSNTRFSFGGGSLNTPKIGKCKKEFTNINLRGFKAQKTWRGCLSRIKRVSKFSFLYMLWYLLS